MDETVGLASKFVDLLWSIDCMRLLKPEAPLRTISITRSKDSRASPTLVAAPKVRHISETSHTSG